MGFEEKIENYRVSLFCTEAVEDMEDNKLKQIMMLVENPYPDNPMFNMKVFVAMRDEKYNIRTLDGISIQSMNFFFENITTRVDFNFGYMGEIPGRTMIDNWAYYLMTKGIRELNMDSSAFYPDIPKSIGMEFSLKKQYNNKLKEKWILEERIKTLLKTNIVKYQGDELILKPINYN